MNVIRTMDIDTRHRAKVDHMYDLLMRGEYAMIVELTGGVLLTADEIGLFKWTLQKAI